MRHGRLALYVLLFFLIAINYADRIALSIGARPIALEFHISTVGMGYLFSCFLWTYVLCLIPWGFVVDRIGTRAVSAIGMTIWSLATIATGLSPTLAAIFASRLAMGAGEATAFPAAGRLVREWVPAGERGLASMIVVSGGYAGPALGSVLFAGVASALGWRGGFVVVGGIGLLWLLACRLWFRNPQGGTEDRRASVRLEGPHDQPRGLARLWRSTSMWGLFLTQGACVYTHYLFLTWMPSYLQTTRHLTIMRTGLLSAVPYAITVVASLLLAAASDRLLRDAAASGRRRSMVAAMMLVSAVVLATPFVESTWLIMIVFTISLIGTSAATGLNSALLADLLRTPDDAGKANGMLVVGGNIFGLMAPIATGYIIAATGSYNGGFVISGLLLLAGAAIVMTMTHQPIDTSGGPAVLAAASMPV